MDGTSSCRPRRTTSVSSGSCTASDFRRSRAPAHCPGGASTGAEFSLRRGAVRMEALVEGKRLRDSAVGPSEPRAVRVPEISAGTTPQLVELRYVLSEPSFGRIQPPRLVRGRVFG